MSPRCAPPKPPPCAWRSKRLGLRSGHPPQKLARPSDLPLPFGLTGFVRVFRVVKPGSHVLGRRFAEPEHDRNVSARCRMLDVDDGIIHHAVMEWTPPDGIDVPKWWC